MDINALRLMADTLTAEINTINDEIAELDHQKALKISDRTRLSNLYTAISVGVNAYDKAIEALEKSNR